MSATTPRPAAFIDRDGTLIVEHGFLDNPDGVQPLPGAIDAVRRLNDWGYRVIGVTNQSGVARGYFGEDAVRRVNERVRAEFASAGAVIDAMYYCPHYPLDGKPVCNCRKPDRGMIDQAMSDFPIDLSQSVTVGDRLCDVLLGQNLGIPGVLVQTGYGSEELRRWDHPRLPDHVAVDIREAIDWWGRLHNLSPRSR